MSSAALPVSGSAHTKHALAHDPEWPRTGGWSHNAGERCDVGVIGVPTSRTSLSPSHAHLTPAAVRDALRRYSSHVVYPELRGGGESAPGVVLDDRLRINDFGDCPDPDDETGETAAVAQISAAVTRSRLLITLGGDNAATVPAVLGLAQSAGGFEGVGLITIDAHHDVRDGRSNGSPVARLVHAGLDPHRIVQIGIADFANSREYRELVSKWGITVIHRDEVSPQSLPELVREACGIAGASGGMIHVDVDVDVCDRSVAPGCPASLPGGLSAWELRRAIRLCATDNRVRSFDFTEVDAAADTADGRTVRLVALGVLEAVAGLAARGA